MLTFLKSLKFPLSEEKLVSSPLRSHPISQTKMNEVSEEFN